MGDNIKIPFYYSKCGEDWTPVTNGGTEALYTDEELCCTPGGRFRRCDGSDYQTECSSPSCVQGGVGYNVTQQQPKGNLIKTITLVYTAKECGQRCEALGVDGFKGWTYANSQTTRPKVRFTCWCLNSLSGASYPTNQMDSGTKNCPKT